MKIVAKKNISHNGSSYAAGDIIESIKKEDAERLISLGAAKDIASTEEKEEVSKEEGSEENKNSKGKKEDSKKKKQ